MDEVERDQLPSADEVETAVTGATAVAEAPEPQFVEVELVQDAERSFSLGEVIYNLGLGPRLAVIGALVALALVSIFALTPVFTNPATYAPITETLDAKEGNVLGLTAAATSASAAITAIPGDTGTTIAEKLADLTVGFVIILVAIFLMKYLLTVIGFIFFAILVPACCALAIASILLRGYVTTRRSLTRVALKLLIMGFVFLFLVPTSVWTANMIDATYESSINQTMEQAEAAGEAAEQAQAAEATEAADDGNWLAGAWNSVTGAIGSVGTWFQDTFNNFVQALAVMLVTSCVIPILVLILFLNIAKAILNIDISRPMAVVDPRIWHATRTQVMGKVKGGAHGDGADGRAPVRADK